MLTAAQQQRIRTEVARYITIAEEKYDRTFKAPTILFNLKGTTAGTANPKEWRLKFQPVLAANHFDDFVARTVPHEVAHLIDFEINNKIGQPRAVTVTRSGRVRRAKRSLHGESWKRVMRVFGVTDITRCHSYDTSMVKSRRGVRFDYICNGCGKKMDLGASQHKKMQAKTTEYWMKGCKDHGGYTYKTKAKPYQPPVQLAAQAPKAGSGGAIAPAIAKTTPPFVVKPTPPFPAKSGTKAERAYSIVYHNQHQDRNFVITKIMNELNMTWAGAQTYYYNAKKRC